MKIHPGEVTGVAFLPIHLFIAGMTAPESTMF
jgi:hypothetical protein